MSFFSKIFGGGKASEPKPAERSEPVAHGEFQVCAAPEPAEGGQWRLAGVIFKDGMERSLIRVDTFASRDDAVEMSLRKGRQLCDEQGAKLFKDGAPTGRA